MNKVSYKLYANCIPVRGARRSTICDLQKREAHPMPNDLYDLLVEKNGVFNVAELQKEVEDDSHPVLQEYLDFLLKNKLVHRCSNPENFPDLDLTWQHPSQITNAILDYNSSSRYSLRQVLDQLEELGCQHVQLRFFSIFDLQRLDNLLKSFLSSRFISFEVYLAYDRRVTKKMIRHLCEKHKRISYLTIHGSPATIAPSKGNGLERVSYVEERITDATHCGFISQDYLNVNMELFTEAQNFNTCLNRKISVDTKGIIKNCPATQTPFGHVKDTSLHSALAHKNFKDLWEVNKDQIEVCKDCEFRYICTDCRAFITNPEDKYSKPSKCSYDPYTAEWGDLESQSSNN